MVAVEAASTVVKKGIVSNTSVFRYFANSLSVSHSKAECAQPPKARPCYNCGEEGHTKAECTNPAVAREFTGTCRLCEQSGHRASECPSAPPKLCNNCKEEGRFKFNIS